MGNKKGGNSMTDDELLDKCIADNKQCAAISCSNSIKVIAMQCSLCTRMFCPTHQLPESHGCGQAARKDAKMAHPKPVNELKAADLHGKMNKKLQQMKNERKKKVAGSS